MKYDEIKVKDKVHICLHIGDGKWQYGGVDRVMEKSEESERIGCIKLFSQPSVRYFPTDLFPNAESAREVALNRTQKGYMPPDVNADRTTGDS